MIDIDKMKAELTFDEGSRLRPYKDTVGKLTIGVGRNLDDNGISKDEEALMLSNDIRRTIEELNFALPWWVNVDATRQRVMVNMAFNLGMKKFLGFKNTLSLIQAGKYADAASAMMDSLWAKQVGKRAERLAEMMKNGVV